MHGDLLKSVHFSFTPRVVGSVVVEHHGPLVGALEGLVASAFACVAFEGTHLDGLIGGVEDDEALGLKLLIVGG